ncbi:MAG: class I SAM-dependent methyltransferase [Actinomycetota bacterium]
MLSIGLGMGWRCLDVGGGSGSVAIWLAERVAPDGKVVVTDIDTRFLEPIRRPGLDVWRHDVVVDSLPEAEFDLVHTRSVLMHLPERETVMRRLVTALRPGGWLVVEESDFYPVEASADDPYRSGWLAANRGLEAAGMAPRWARELPSVLDHLGLVDIGAEADVAMFQGGSDMAQLMQLGLLQAGDLLPEDQRGVIHVAVAALENPKRWFPGTAVVAARGRRP